MKKLLLSILVLVQAVSIQAMGSKSKGLGDISKPAVSKAGVVSRYSLPEAPAAQPVVVAPVAPAQEVPVVPADIGVNQAPQPAPISIAPSTAPFVFNTGISDREFDEEEQEDREREKEKEYDFGKYQSFVDFGPSAKPASPSKPYNYTIVNFNDADKTKKHIGLICIHGTWATSAGMGANPDRVFANALQQYAQQMATENNATVTMIIPQWSGGLSTLDRLSAANAIDRTLLDLNTEHPFDELHAIAHSHGCNVLLNLALIGAGLDTFNVKDTIKTMILIAAPGVVFDEFYQYPPNCHVYAFYSRHDSVQQIGSGLEKILSTVKPKQSDLQLIPIANENIGKVYNIAVEYLPEDGAQNPNHKTIKQPSLMDCLPAIQQIIEKVYKNYPDLKLWIVKRDHTYNPMLALNNARTTEKDLAKQEIAQETSKNIIEHIPKLIPSQKGYLSDYVPQWFFIPKNLFNEIITKDKLVTLPVPVIETSPEQETSPSSLWQQIMSFNPFSRGTPSNAALNQAAGSVSSSSSSSSSAQPEPESETPSAERESWDVVSDAETQKAIQLRRAEEALIEARNLLPAHLQSSINPNLHNSANPLKDLENARETLWFYLLRSDKNFVSLYIDTVNKNFQPCPELKPQDAYRYLGYPNNPTAIDLPNSTLAERLAEKLAAAALVNDEKALWCLRQLGFIFRNEITKQTFDAYLKGPNALKALEIPQEKAAALQACHDTLMEIKYTLGKLDKKAAQSAEIEKD